MKAWLLLLLMLGSVSAVANEQRLIVVKGVAEKSLDPNLVSLSIEVWSKASTAKQAQQLAAQQYKQLKKTFDEYKIKKEDIQTDNYSLNLEYEYDNKTRQNKMVGFRVRQGLSVNLRKVDDAGNFLDAIVIDRKSTEAGVMVNAIAWDSDKRSQVETSALGDAVQSAKMKADEIAKAAGVKIKGVSKISHTMGGGGGQPVYRSYALKSSLEDSAATELSAGQIQVRVEVFAEYEIN